MKYQTNRIDFQARYLHELKRAASEIDLRGYFQWSLMDKFPEMLGSIDELSGGKVMQ